MTPSTPRGTRVSHIGIAVEALAESLPFFRDVLGLREVDLDDSDGARIIGLSAGEPLVELLEAGAANSPIGRFVAKRGPGIHHICFSVDDLDATLERCRRADIAPTRGTGCFTDDARAVMLEVAGQNGETLV